jgi:hypothetical protein
LSADLTGFGRVQLLGSGMADEYLSELSSVLPEGVLEELLSAYRKLPEGSERAAALGDAILGDAKLGPVARNVILLWYRGAWNQLPDDWRSAHGATPKDTNHVVSAASYLAGLQWVLAGGHPVGARQQGYGAWAAAPDTAGPNGAATSQGVSA